LIQDTQSTITYRANEDKRRITLVEDMLIQIRHAVVPNRNMWKERQRPRVSCAHDESINLIDRGAIDEVDCSARDVRDRWLLQDIRVLESVIAEVQVWPMAFDDGGDWVFRYAEQIDGYIGAGAGSVSYVQLPCDVFADLHRSSNDDNTLHSNCQRKSQRPRS
jgi:hypothetical protein